MPSIAEIRDLYKELLEAKRRTAYLEQRITDILELSDTRKTSRKKITTQDAVGILNAMAAERR